MQLRKKSHGEADAFLMAEGSTGETVEVEQVSSARPESKNSARSHMLSAREPGDLGGASSPIMAGVRQPREGSTLEPRSQVSEESDALVVPEKSAKARVTPVESMEGRDAAKGKLASRNVRRTQGRESTLTNLERVGRKATKDKETKFTNLMCHLEVPLLEEAYRRLSKDAAPGVDGVTWSEYGRNLTARLTDLQDRIHRGSYHPLPVRRVFIPKADGRQRPIGIPALEDKLAQQAVRMILEPIYEREFLGFSYGFRPRRSAHDALDALATVIIKKRTNWVLDADIRSFFDTIDHGWLKKFIEHRIADRRLVRLLMKWLAAGAMEEGQLHATQEGTPQGGIISPLLANIYLHYVLDLWANAWRERRARGEVFIVRYADDFVMAFEDGRDAKMMRAALARRLSDFGLKLHEEKTRILRFGRYARERSERLGLRVETFDFLGFTHVVSRDHKNGWFQLRRITSQKKRQRTLADLYRELRRRRHEDIRATHEWISAVLNGYYEYFAVPTNERMLERFRRHLGNAWLRQLQRRSQRGRCWSIAKVKRFEQRFALPRPAIRHPWPEVRFAAR
jgi:group II intron reverse transcriptase/maturase